jgi:succinate dehydrogenase/fumarate reductase flavoprotein subunit
LHNPAGGGEADGFRLENLGTEAYEYLERAGALQATPIERLTAMNPPAVEVFKEHGIDLYREPLEVAVCAQHNNGGFAVDKWWRSNLAQTFVIGEMAGTHGVRRPGGSALNAGQVGGLRAAEYIANACGLDVPDCSEFGARVEKQLSEFVGRLDRWSQSGKLNAKEVIGRIQGRMTACGAHIREAGAVRAALAEAGKEYRRIEESGFKVGNREDFVAAVRAEHMAFGSIAYLKAIAVLLEGGGGSRGSYLVVDEGGTEIHPDIKNPATGGTLRFKPENKSLRDFVLRVKYDAGAEELFSCESIAIRPAEVERKAFEPAWRDYMEGRIFGD